MVSDLKAELSKVKEAARVAREAAEAAVATSYDRGVRDTEVRLTRRWLLYAGITSLCLGV